MAFDKDFFCLHGGPHPVTSRAGGSGADGAYYHVPYADSLGRNEVFSWMFPRAASLSQLVVSNWVFGSSDGPFEPTKMFMTILDDTSQTFAVGTWNHAARLADRGTVWDINHVVLKGATITVTFEQHRGVNQNQNDFTMAITGSWLRDDL